MTLTPSSGRGRGRTVPPLRAVGLAVRVGPRLQVRDRVGGRSRSACTWRRRAHSPSTRAGSRCRSFRSASWGGTTRVAASRMAALLLSATLAVAGCATAPPRSDDPGAAGPSEEPETAKRAVKVGLGAVAVYLALGIYGASSCTRPSRTPSTRREKSSRARRRAYLVQPTGRCDAGRRARLQPIGRPRMRCEADERRFAGLGRAPRGGTCGNGTPAARPSPAPRQPPPVLRLRGPGRRPTVDHCSPGRGMR